MADPLLFSSFATGGSNEGAKRKLIARTRISLTGVANPFTKAQYTRLQEINALLNTPAFAGGGPNYLKAVDRRTYNEYARLSKAFDKATKSKAQPGFFVINSSVTKEGLPGLIGLNQPF